MSSRRSSIFNQTHGTVNTGMAKIPYCFSEMGSQIPSSFRKLKYYSSLQIEQIRNDGTYQSEFTEPEDDADMEELYYDP
jgi:hypothetical protein